MSLIRTWAPFFQNQIRMRGRAFQQDGRVTRLPPEEGELFRAQVRGDGDQVFTASIYLDGEAPTAACTCPFFEGGRFCRHIWALIVDVQSKPDEGELNGDGGEALARIESTAPHFPKARKRQGGAAAARTSTPIREPDWMGRLTLLRPATYAADQPVADAMPPQRQVVYVVVPELCHRHAGLVVEVRQRTPTAAGWSKTKPMRVSRDTLGELDDPLDRELCALLIGATWVDYGETGEDYRSGRSHAAYRLPPGAARSLLTRMIDTGRAMLEHEGEEQALAREPDDAPPWVLWAKATWSGDTPRRRELIVRAELRRGDERLAMDRPTLVVTGPDGMIVCDGVLAAFDDREASRWVSQFRDELRLRGDIKPIMVPEADVPRFLDRLYLLPHLPELDLPEDVGRTEHRVTPRAHLEVFSPEHAPGGLAGLPKGVLVARGYFDYEGQRVRPGQAGRFLNAPASGSSEGGQEQAATDTRLIRRDHRAESEALRLLATLGLRPLAGGNGAAERALLLSLAARDLPTVAMDLIARGWQVTADQQALVMPATPSLSVSSGIDWFELHGNVSYRDASGGQRTVSLPEILAAVKSGRTMVQLDDGSQGLLPEAWLNQHRMLTTMGIVEGDHLRFTSGQAVMLDAMLGRDAAVEVDAKFADIRRRLDEFAGIASVEPPATFRGTLRPYQKLGLGWLAFLRWLGCGGILADDMGLGKTIQVLAMLDARRRGAGNGEQGSGQNSPQPDGVTTPIPDPSTPNPTLIVVPRSVVFNWIDEAAKFAPELRVQAYTGADRQSLRDAFTDHDVIVTSYGLMRRDIEELSQHTFDYVVLDEAQAIKNPQSQSAKAARLLRGAHRLALTGTPVENHLGDLWSIFEFLNPGMLGSSTRFAEWIRTSASGVTAKRNRDEDAAVQIGKALRPFILRRTKSQVLTDLPEKTEQTLVCEMEDAQRATYDELRQFYRASLLGKVEYAQGAGGSGERLAGRSAIMVLEALLRLRQAACHPGLIDPARIDEPSAKLDTLLERVSELIEEGHKALVFSQFTSMLAIVRKRLDERGIVYEYMDGQTRDRKSAVDRFQNDTTVPLFLISLKTGGLGLNLTAAGYVFILDPWWNPAAEQQAIDRAHRIGQTQRVVAYRLLCENTVEQRIAELQAKKKRLADAIVGGQQSSLLQQLTREDLESLLA